MPLPSSNRPIPRPHRFRETARRLLPSKSHPQCGATPKSTAASISHCLQLKRSFYDEKFVESTFNLDWDFARRRSHSLPQRHSVGSLATSDLGNPPTKADRNDLNRNISYVQSIQSNMKELAGHRWMSEYTSQPGRTFDGNILHLWSGPHRRGQL